MNLSRIPWGAGMDQGLNQEQAQEQAETPSVNSLVRQEKSPKWVWEQPEVTTLSLEGSIPRGKSQL